MSYGYVDPYGDPTDHNGNALRFSGGRINEGRMNSRQFSRNDDYNDGKYYSSYSGNNLDPREFPYLDGPSTTQERYSRGYNPEYYGQPGPRSVCSSAPGAEDHGYQGETYRNVEGTPMDHVNQGYHQEENLGFGFREQYDQMAGSLPKPPGKRSRGPEWRGNPVATADDHARLAYLSGQASHHFNNAIHGRQNSDVDFIGHYRDNESRRGHHKRLNDDHTRHNRASQQHRDHTKWSGY